MMNLIFLIFAVFVIFGGYMGFKKAGSKASLIAGTVSGILILIGVLVSGQFPTFGLCLIRTVLLLLIVSFSIRLVKTKKFMPSGMLLMLSVIVFLLSIKSL